MVLKLMKSPWATSRVSWLDVIMSRGYLPPPPPTSEQDVSLMMVKIFAETFEMFNHLTWLVTGKISLTLAAMKVSDLT